MALAPNMPARPVKGNVSAQDKILYVANKLGLSSLKYMQATTRVVYDQILTESTNHSLFEGCSQRAFPNTNLSDNQFQVDEALLIEKIAFYEPNADGISFSTGNNYKFDLIIGNKTVIKDAVMMKSGEQAFTDGGDARSLTYTLEGVGILIPPQVEFKINVKVFGSSYVGEAERVGCYLYGTGVLLNFNTSI